MQLRTRCMKTRWMGRHRATAVMSWTRKCVTTGIVGMSLAMAGGCATAPAASSATEQAMASSASTESSGVLGFLGGMTDSALTAVGLKKPEVPEMPQRPNVPDSALPDWRVNWRLFASDSLNVDENGQPLALLVRIYRLRNADTFLQAPYEAFGDPNKEKLTLGEDLVAVREVQLLPGQRHEALDKVAREAHYIGIVALYRNPSTGRWRYAFNTASAERSGLHLGAHACAMSVQLGEPIGPSVRSARSTAAPCP